VLTLVHSDILISRFLGLTDHWPRKQVRNPVEHEWILRQLVYRFVLASTQELHEKISELSIRVRELEDALRTSHQHLSMEQHPLLNAELLQIKAPLQRDPASSNTSLGLRREGDVNPEIVDAFGSLSIGLSGEMKYFGSTANSWVRRFFHDMV
jgi:hypothetical protein